MDITNVSSIEESLINDKLNRTEADFDQIDARVKEIINDVKNFGDEALKKFTEKFDGAQLTTLKVSQAEIDAAYESIDEEFINVLQEAKQNIIDFHQAQLEKSWLNYKNDGIILGQKVTPLDRIGVYVPGGKAAYPSTVLMTVLPAVVAGVNEIALVSPPDKDGNVHPYVLAAAKIAGVQEIYRVGGAQAIAALAYGTETIRPVDKIVGPGNIYVARAKKYVFGTVDIDMIAGPSEVCIIADEKQNPVFIAADLLSQAEHDEMAASILVTNSTELATAVQKEVENQLAKLERKDIARQSIDQYGQIFVVDTLDEAFNVANIIAPEHLELLVADPFANLSKVKHAGAIFLGPYAPEPLGDYFAGPNHTLPTSGTARFSSPLGTYDFLKRSSVIFYNQEELEKVKNQVVHFANEEGLGAHANSIQVRFNCEV
ncbi:histidinol dehydrogenase [Pallidibacillus pasinlerensis]|uniref:Histidinol dehydrogenase n=1 Tax=Pallidibacillus pasinlerensis TaxID=2703818 RepID=A0ABW9ZZY4_9BACI|nr:histidinol dehydrogenase [Pallidibacillus pasinlerensis]NCU16741.1 histidinol dehydrogenase [Pallidibacillus pasinlerensis]